MADEKKTPETETNDDAPKPAQVHHKDKGKIVTTAFGEPMSGGIADIADGDDE